MSRHLGDYATSTVIYGKFTTFRPSTGAAFTLGGTPALSVYKDNSTIQSTTGVTLTADFDTVTGLNHYTIDTSADGTFYSAGSNFDIVITTGTVDSVSVVGTVVGSFSLNKTAALRPTIAGRTLDVASTGEAGLDFDNILLTNGQSRLGIFASGTLSGTHSSTTADLGTNAPSVDITGKILNIPTHALSRSIDSYNTVTGVATFSPSTAATLANGDAWYLFDSPLASTTTLPDVNVAQISGDAIAANNCESFFDGTGYAGTGNTIPTVTTVNGLAANVVTASALATDAVSEIQSGLATAADLATVAGYLDTEITAILADTNELQTDWANGGRLDLILDARASQTSVDDIPTVAEFEARTPTAAQLAYIVANAATGLPVTFTTSGGSTTAAVLNTVDGAAPSATNDQYNGRLLVFTDGTLKGVVTDITDYVGGTTTATITAIPTAPTASHNARLI